MNVVEITNKTEWTTLFTSAGSMSFIQSWEWGEFQHTLGNKIFRIGIKDNNSIKLIATVELLKMKRGTILCVPHGPLFISGQEFDPTNHIHQSLFMELINWLNKTARSNHCACIRVAPFWTDSPSLRSFFSKIGFRTAPLYMHAERMWILDIRPPEDRLLSQMRKTTRYLIKKAERDSISIHEITGDSAVNAFISIYTKTAKREQFVPFSKEYISAEYQTFYSSHQSTMYVGNLYQSNSVLASALIIFTPSTAFYHQGASLHSKEPVPYLLQWRAIQEAKKRGCSFYNFWGIVQLGRTPSSWKGLTQFKQGFGGFQKDLLATQDQVISFFPYIKLWLIEKYIAVRRQLK